MKPNITKKTKGFLKKGVGSSFSRELKYNGQLYLLLLPAILYFTIFCYIPMYGVQIAFKNFNPVLGIIGSKFVGFKHFIRFFNSYQFALIIKNTLIISLYYLIADFPIAIILAIIINQMRQKKLKGLLQTVAFAPHFISTPAMVGIIIILLAPGTGILNRLVTWIIGRDAGVILGNSRLFNSIYVWTGIWQNMGWESIIYTAVLTSINPELYEAADIDGAGKFRKILSIDLPALMPTAITMLILNSGKMLNIGFEKVFLMQNSMNLIASEVISTYVYKVGLAGADFSYSTAINLFNSVVNLIILITVNYFAKKTSEVSLW